MTPTGIVRRYIELLDGGAEPEVIAPLLHPDIEQRELPNALAPTGQVRGRDGMLKGVAAGKALLAEQRYVIDHIIEAGDQVVVEMRWSGVLAIDAGPLAKGTRLECAICTVIELRDGMVYRQRNYDCYAPFVAPEEKA